jgi:class III poly(R)-hydroxyalkanoic acid synthase PhaE subunit
VDPFEYMQALAGLFARSGAAVVAAQQNMMRDMAAQATAAVGDDKAASLAQAYLPQAEGLAAAGEAYSKLWSSALELSATLTRNLQSGERPDPIVTGMLGKIFDPRLWFGGSDDLDETLHRLAEGPRLADMWEIERKFLAVFNAWAALRRRSLEHNTVMLEAWMQAAGDFAKNLSDKADRDEVLESARDLMALWVETANRALLETQRSEPFLRTQRYLLQASTDLRLAQNEVADFYSEMFGYPTRAELDDVHKSVTELRREVRALRREGRTSNPQQKPSSDVPELAPSLPPGAGRVAGRSSRPRKQRPRKMP